MRRKKELFVGLLAVLLILGLLAVPALPQGLLPDWVLYQVERASYAYFDLTVWTGGGLLTPGQYPAWCTQHAVPIPTGTSYWGRPVLLDTEVEPWNRVLFALTHREGYTGQQVQDALWYWIEGRDPEEPGTQPFIDYVESAYEAWQPPDGTFLVKIQHADKQDVLLVIEGPPTPTPTPTLTPTPTPTPVGALQIDKKWSGPGNFVEEIVVYAYPKEHAPPERTPRPVRTPRPLPDGWRKLFIPLVARDAYMPVILRWQGEPVCVDGLQPGLWVLEEQVVPGSGHAPVQQRLEVEVLPDTWCSEGDPPLARFENVRTPTPTPEDWILGWESKAIDPPGPGGENREELAPKVEPSGLSDEELTALAAFIEGAEQGDFDVKNVPDYDFTLVAIRDSRTGDFLQPYLMETTAYGMGWEESEEDVPQCVVQDAGADGPSIQNGDFTQGELHWTLPSTNCTAEVVTHEGAPALRLGPGSADVRCWSSARQHLSPNYELYLGVYNDGAYGGCYLYGFFRGVYVKPQQP